MERETEITERDRNNREKETEDSEREQGFGKQTGILKVGKAAEKSEGPKTDIYL